MGTTQSQPKFSLTPPRIFITRREYLIAGQLKSGQLAKNLINDFVCPTNKLVGTTLLLSEKSSEDVFIECDSDISVGQKAVDVSVSARVCNPFLLGAVQFTQKSFDTSLTYNPFGILSLFFNN